MNYRILISCLFIACLFIGTVNAETKQWGNTGVGTSNDLWAQRTTTALLTAPDDIGTLLSIYYYSKDNSGTLDLKCGIWETDGTLVPDSITNIISGVDTTPAWRYANFSAQPSLVASTAYLVGCVASDNYNNYYYVIGPGLPNQFRYGAVDYDTPGNFTESSNLNQVMSIYVEYTTPSAGDPPVASFTTSKTFVRIPQSITFTDTSTETPDEWLWDFGDGTTSTDQSPVHKYTKRGKWNVTLTLSLIHI